MRTCRKACEVRREGFLAALRQGLSVEAAATSIGVHPVTVYKWRWKDAAFDRAWTEAVEEGACRIAVEALHRGMTRRAPPPATITDCSDKQVAYLLRARRPGEFVTPSVFEAPAPPDLAERIAAGRQRAWGDASPPHARADMPPASPAAPANGEGPRHPKRSEGSPAS